jgi:hypothetical protein
MTIGEKIVVEKLENDEAKEMSQTRKRRFLIDVRFGSLIGIPVL